ncbi:MAG: DUF2185 domain-containing protein [Firmicutes bacterium]|nr:DUF2185 domain-containing protein [Bacillota bacterium]
MAYTTTEKILGIIKDYQQKLYNDSIGKSLKQLDQKQFVMLLSAVASCRKWPTFSEPVDFYDFYRCKSFEEREKTAEWLDENYGITDWVTLENACRANYNVHEDYKHFWAQWNNLAEFEELNYEPAQLFKLNRCNAYAKNFASIVGEAGFYAWDCNERLGLCRCALACNIINEEEFWYAVIPHAKKAAAFFNNWVEYGISYLCGFLYHTYQQHNCSEEITPQFKVGFGITQFLFDNHWGDKAWFEFSKEYAIQKEEMKNLLIWDGPDLCIATNRITVDRFPVGYMYREVPDPNFNDSGWRFYQGSEDDDYAYDLSNSGTHSLNDICNYDPAIIPYLGLPVGTGLVRGLNNTFEVVQQD